MSDEAVHAREGDVMHAHLDWFINDDRPMLVAHLEREHGVVVSDENRDDPAMHGAYERLHRSMHGAPWSEATR